jgi:segregation and condensation protein B
VQQQPTDSLIQERFRADDVQYGDSELDAAIEALLLVAPEPATATELARGIGATVHEVQASLLRLQQRLDRGWIVQRHGETVQLTTAPRFAEHVRRFLGIERLARLSAAALETLAIIAYRQPVTRSEIEAVRGVDSSGVLATLLQRELTECVGRQDGPGQPMLYSTTPAFLMHFGLQSLAELPSLGEINGVSGQDYMTDLLESAQDSLATAASASGS